MGCNIFQNDSHALLIAERGVDYHKLDYEAKIEYWQEVEIVMTFVLNLWICDNCDDDVDDNFVEIGIFGDFCRLEENQAGGRRCSSLLPMLRRLIVLMIMMTMMMVVMVMMMVVMMIMIIMLSLIL